MMDAEWSRSFLRVYSIIYLKQGGKYSVSFYMDLCGVAPPLLHTAPDVKKKHTSSKKGIVLIGGKTRSGLVWGAGEVFS